MSRRTDPAPVWRLGSLSPSKEGPPHYVLPQKERIETAQEKWCPASMPNLTPEEARRHFPMLREPARSNCDHSHLPSAGQGC